MLYGKRNYNIFNEFSNIVAYYYTYNFNIYSIMSTYATPTYANPELRSNKERCKDFLSYLNEINLILLHKIIIKDNI